MQSDATVIQHTRCWISSVIVGLNFCPFARREVEAEKISYRVCHHSDTENVLHTLIDECKRLDEQPGIETTLIIFANGFKSFDEYLDMLGIANNLLVEQGYEGIYQIASFHPDYCFEGASKGDAANYTNRSPYPMLHLIREASLEQALETFPSPESIPERNIELARDKGVDEMKTMLNNCMRDTDS